MEKRIYISFLWEPLKKPLGRPSPSLEDNIKIECVKNAITTARTVEMKNKLPTNLLSESAVRRQLWKPKLRCDHNIKIDLKKYGSCCGPESSGFRINTNDLRRAIVQAVSHWLFTAAARVRTRV
jgi:hypothetical protein